MARLNRFEFFTLIPLLPTKLNEQKALFTYITNKNKKWCTHNCKNVIIRTTDQQLKRAFFFLRRLFSQRLLKLDIDWNAFAINRCPLISFYGVLFDKNLPLNHVRIYLEILQKALDNHSVAAVCKIGISGSKWKLYFENARNVVLK